MVHRNITLNFSVQKALTEIYSKQIKNMLNKNLHYYLVMSIQSNHEFLE